MLLGWREYASLIIRSLDILGNKKWIFFTSHRLLMVLYEYRHGRLVECVNKVFFLPFSLIAMYDDLDELLILFYTLLTKVIFSKNT